MAHYQNITNLYMEVTNEAFTLSPNIASKEFVTIYSKEFHEVAILEVSMSLF